MNRSVLWTAAGVMILMVSCGREYMNPLDCGGKGFEGQVVVSSLSEIRPRSPDDGAVVAYPDLIWGITEAPAEVELQVARSEGFESATLGFSRVFDRGRVSSVVRLPGLGKIAPENHPELKKLAPGIWFWRIRSRKIGGVWGAWSGSRRFVMKTVLISRIWSVRDFDETKASFLMEEPDYDLSGEVVGGRFYDFPTQSLYRIWPGPGDEESRLRYREDPGTGKVLVEEIRNRKAGYSEIREIFRDEVLMRQTSVTKDLSGTILYEESAGRDSPGGELVLEESRSYEYDAAGQLVLVRVVTTDRRFEIFYEKGLESVQKVYSVGDEVSHQWVYHHGTETRKDLLVRLDQLHADGSPDLWAYHYFYNLDPRDGSKNNISLGYEQMEIDPANGRGIDGAFSQ